MFKAKLYFDILSSKSQLEMILDLVWLVGWVVGWLVGLLVDQRIANKFTEYSMLSK